MKDKIEKKNFLWSTIGSLLFGFTSLIFLIVTTRINGVDIAGVFTYAFAVSCTLYAIGHYAGKVFQVTETNKNISDSDYIYNKLLTCTIMIVIGIVFGSFHDKIKFFLIVILTLYKSLDVLIDSFHAITQRNGALYKVGISMTIRTFLLILGFIFTDYFFQNIFLACCTLLLINFIFCLFVDYKVAKKFFKMKKFNKKNNMYLLKSGFLMFCYSFLSAYVINIPKYAINEFMTDDIQAIFGIIVMPASFLALVAVYITQPFLNYITDNISNSKALKKIFKRISLVITAIGLVAVIICYFIGIPILEIIYGIELSAQKLNFLIILCGAIFYSIFVFISAFFVAMRKNGVQLLILFLTTLFALPVCYILTNKFSLFGASIGYTLVMICEFILYLVIFFRILKKKRYTIRLMGGLGNQMFEYSVLRAMMLENSAEGVISLKGITNKTHNVYCLNHFNISEDVKIKKGESLKSFVNYLFYGFYYIFLIKKKNGFDKMKKVQPILNNLGYYCVPDGYIELNNSSSNRNEMIGYYQSAKYFEKYKDIIKKELKVIDEVFDKNIDLLNDIKKSNSICVHIRRGDYVGSNHQVCDEEYYLEAEKIILKKVKNPKFYIFSDDQKWVKENVKFKSNVIYVEGNSNFEDLRLMYSCKHFIISNSSFSWWAQYLADNSKRITIAPSIWFQNSNQKSNIYEDDWILIDVKNDKQKNR